MGLDYRDPERSGWLNVRVFPTKSAHLLEVIEILVRYQFAIGRL